MIRTANNAYFPQLMSVISLPDRDEALTQAVDAAWEFLEELEDLEQLKDERRKAKVKAALEGLSDEEVFTEIQTRRAGTARDAKTVKQAEIETLVASRRRSARRRRADLADQSFSPTQLAIVLELMLKARSQRAVAEDLIDLVTTGPEAPGICNRDTSVVVRDLRPRASLGFGCRLRRVSRPTGFRGLG